MRRYDKDYVRDDMRNALAEYLFEVDKWRYYEVVLFGNSMMTLTTDMLKMVTLELVKSPVLTVEVRKNTQLRIQLLYNVALTMIEKKELEFAKELIKETWKSIEKDETLVLERIKLHYLEGYHMYKCREDEAGRKLMKEAIETFNTYKCMHLASNFEDHYEKNVKKSL
ncbi:hypothetical protein [Phocicoccus pinnipedialis]|uniref:Rgg family transcriptional regulator n=1 Tax=Phocicoccus pinnipedialis TaxID=110845 RepID=UPI0022A72702